MSRSLARAIAGLDRDEAVEVLADDRYAAEVRAAEDLWRAGEFVRCRRWWWWWRGSI